MKKWLFLLLAVVTVGGGAYFWWGLTGVQPLQEKVLTFGEVRQTTIRDTISATGLVEPREIIFVSSESPGTVVRLWKGIGDTVTQGADLAQLDERKILLKIEEANTGVKMAESAILQAKAALTQADATKEAAHRNLKIQESLEAVGGIRAEREQAKAQLDAAVAGIQLAKAGIEVANAKKEAAQTALNEALLAQELNRVKVPGQRTWGWLAKEFLILDRKVHQGQMVGPQSGPLFMLAGSLDIVEVHAQVVEGDVNKIREGLTALFTITSYDNEETDFQGIVKRIRPLSSNVKGAVYYNAVIEVRNRKDPKTGDWQLRPGMTAAVDLVRTEHKDAWRVPSGALDFTLEEAYQSDSAKKRLAEWKRRADEKDWRPLWVWNDTTRQPEPIFVRVGGKKNGEIGLKDSEGNEVLEWEPGKQPTRPLRVIIKAPPARPPGFFDQPANVKI